MSQANETTSAPVLRQSVKFGERYVSSALNRKLAGIIAPGIYHGFIVKPGGEAKVLVTHSDDYPQSIAVLERNGYNITITMDDPGYVQIPAPGTWYIVIEAFYVETQPGYQRIVAREAFDDHHIVLAKITVEDIGAPIEQSMIDMADRQVGIASHQGLSAMLSRLSALEQFDKLHDIIATLEKLGHVKPDGMTIGIKPDGTIYVTPAAVYELAEFYLFRHPTPRPGFEVLDGHIVEGAAKLYPDAWGYLQSSDGQLLCKTEEEWQSLSQKIYYTLADGTKVGFNGIGGVGYYSLNTATGALRMPDIRGQFFGAAQSASLNVPGVSLIDSIREIAGHWGNAASNVAGIHAISTGACLWYINGATNRDIFELVNIGSANPGIKASRVHPVSESVRPKSIGMLACAWMGVPTN